MDKAFLGRLGVSLMVMLVYLLIVAIFEDQGHFVEGRRWVLDILFLLGATLYTLFGTQKESNHE